MAAQIVGSCDFGIIVSNLKNKVHPSTETYEVDQGTKISHTDNLVCHHFCLSL